MGIPFAYFQGSDSLLFTSHCAIPMSLEPKPDEGTLSTVSTRFRPAFAPPGIDGPREKRESGGSKEPSGARARRCAAPKPRMSPSERWMRAGTGPSSGSPRVATPPVPPLSRGFGAERMYGQAHQKSPGVRSRDRHLFRSTVSAPLTAAPHAIPSFGVVARANNPYTDYIKSPWPGLTRPPSAAASAVASDSIGSRTLACWAAASRAAMVRVSCYSPVALGRRPPSPSTVPLGRIAVMNWPPREPSFNG